MSEQRTMSMRERLAKAIVPLRYHGNSPEARECSLPDAPVLWENCLPIVDAILAKLRDLNAAMDEAGANELQHFGFDVTPEQFSTAKRAAIDAIREGEG